MNTGIAAATTSQMATAVELPVTLSQASQGKAEECTEESFEATIVRLDGPTAESLFREAGMTP